MERLPLANRLLPRLLPRLLVCGTLLLSGPATAWGEETRQGAAAFGDWTADAPGMRRLITEADLPAPNATPSANKSPAVIPMPPDLKPKLPAGFTAEPLVSGLNAPRTMRVAPNGDIFVAEQGAGRVIVLRLAGGRIEAAVFASTLAQPFGIAFYPPGPDPRFVYIADGGSIIRYPYRNGDMTARELGWKVMHLPAGGHWTRDILFSPDGRRLFISVGSFSNAAEDMPRKRPDAIREFEATHGLGAAWAGEEGRADVLVTDPEGRSPLYPYATGLRNCVAMATDPVSGDLWCTNNERDGMGDDLPPDFVTRVREGAFYGWPWYYIGAHEDLHHKGERPDLAGKVTLPDFLLQPHSAPMTIAFYTKAMFPAEYRGDAFVALHGSWNRGLRTGYKIVRLLMKDGKPTGVYEDFMTGLVADAKSVYARPVGLAVAMDGALLVSEDGNGTIWRITHDGRK